MVERERAERELRSERKPVTLKSKRNELIRSGQATRRDGSLGRKVKAATDGAEREVQTLLRMNAKQRRHALRQHHRLMEKWKRYRASLPEHSPDPSPVSDLTLDSGRSLQFRERIDSNHSLDPFWLKGFKRVEPLPLAKIVAGGSYSRGLGSRSVILLRRNSDGEYIG
jgi:hypothetical protein